MKFTHNTSYAFAFAAILIAMLFGNLYFYQTGTSPELASGSVELVRVVDGDTVRVSLSELGEVKVRLIGIDAPELDECFGPEARDALAELLYGQSLRLDKDVEAVDFYDRLLRYLVIENPGETEDNLLVNEYLVRQGIAFYYSSPPNNRYRELLVRAEEEARNEKRGLWDACDYLAEREAENADLRESDSEPPSAECIIKGNISEKGYGMTYLIPGCDNYERTKIDQRKGEKWFCTESEAIEAGFRKATNCP